MRTVWEWYENCTLYENRDKISEKWKVSKYEVFSGPYSPTFGLTTGKFGPKETPYLDIFRAEQ